MAVSQVFAQSRSAISRGLTISRVATIAIRPARPAFSLRPFTSSAASSQEARTSTTGAEVPSTPTRDAPTGANARSIAVFKVPRHAVKSEIENVLRKQSFDIKKIQIQHDRFSFTNRGSCFIELASEQQAQEAVQKLNGKKFMDSKLAVTPIKEDFIWGGSPNSPENVTNERYFLDEGNQAAEAIRPILEGRRYILKVATPGWASKDQSENQNQVARRLIAEHFGPFGLEAVGQLSVFYGDHKSHPRMLCMIDFKTQEGAERAVAALDNTEIEGRLTQLVVSRPAPWRADQMGKVDKSLLKALEEKGLLDEPVREDKFRTKRYPESKGSRKQS